MNHHFHLKFVAIINLVATTTAVSITIKRLRKTLYPSRILFFTAILISLNFRPFILAFSKNELLAPGITLSCKIGFFFLLLSQFFSSLGIPFFSFLSFPIVIFRFTEKQLRPFVYGSCGIIFLVTTLMFAKYLYYKQVEHTSIFNICYLRNTNALNIIKLSYFSSTFSFIATIAFWLFIRTRKTGKTVFNTIVLSSAYHSAIPVLSFIVYFASVFQIPILSELPSPYQRLGPFLMSLGYFIFERTVKKRSFWTWRKVLEINLAKELFAKWLTDNNERKGYSAFKEYIQHHKDKQEEPSGNRFLGNGDVLSLERVLIPLVNAFMVSKTFENFADEFEQLGNFEAMFLSND